MLGMTIQPRAYFWTEGNEVVVQNWIAMHEGQKHRHTPEDFERWRRESEEAGWEVLPLNK